MENEKGALRVYIKTISILEGFFGVLIAISMACVVISILLQVFFRYVLNNSLIWSEEMARYMGIFNALLCIGYCVRHHRHVAIDAAVSWIKGSAGKILKVLQNLICAVVFGYCSAMAYQFMIVGGGAPSPAMHWPMKIVYGIVFIGLCNATLLSICAIIDTIFDIDPSTGKKMTQSTKA